MTFPSVTRQFYLSFFTWALPLLAFSQDQNTNAFCNHLHDALDRLQQIHYNPVTADAQVKKEMLDLYVEDADPKHRFFSTEDVDGLKNTAVTEGLCKSYFQSVSIYRKRVREYDSLTKVILAKPFDLNVKEFYAAGTVVKQPRFAEKDRKAQTTVQLKYKQLVMLYDKFIDDSADLNMVKKLVPIAEKETREKLLSRESIFVKRLNAADTDKRLGDIFLNAIAKRYDPHSSYFSQQEKTEFEESLSKDNRSFGLQLEENDNFEIEVAGIVPGSPAWISSQVHEKDILESVTDKKGITHELQYMGMEEVGKLLRDPANEKLEFNLRNTSNEKHTVTLIKGKVENTENSFRGYVFSNDQLKFGYIPLPSFYTDFESDGGLGCANDVAKEILLLKKDNIQGLVLDLRNNGGGSLKEAIEIAGLFIDEGPVGALKMRGEKPILLKDFNRGTVYDGPLVILVNGLSASASEFLSGCLQDYGRAVIIGDETYGKGTAQSVFPVDTSASLANVFAGTFLKITDGKFYHVSQRSNQAKGIRPDIRIPDLYSSIEFFKEKNEPYHLANDSVAKKMFYRKMETGLGPELRSKCQQAIDQNAQLQRISAVSDSLNKMIVENNVPLELSAFVRYIQEKDRFSERIEAMENTKTQIFKVSNHSFSDQLLKLDENERVFNEKVMEELLYDPELEQTFLILKTMVEKK